MSLLDELAQYLADAGAGTLGVDLQVAELPDDPDDLLALAQYGGVAPTYSHSGQTYRSPRFQVTSRAVRYGDALARIELAYRTLAAVANQTIGAGHYLRITPLGDVIPRTRDGNGRVLLEFNAEALRREA